MAGEGTRTRGGGSRTNGTQRHGQVLNPRRYFWFVVGYYLCTVYIRQTAGKSDTFPSADFSSDFQLGTIGFNKQPAELLEGEPSTVHHAREGAGHGEEEHGIKVVKVDFEEVETPFIIALWIFCASLAKIGKLLVSILYLFVSRQSVMCSQSNTSYYFI